MAERIMAETNTGESTPTSGTTPTFGERMRYVATLPEDQQETIMKRLGLEVSGGAEQTLGPEEELNPEGKDPATVMSIMQSIDTMDADTREAHKDVFQQAGNILKEYAHKNKLFGLDARIINLDTALGRTDQAAVDQVNSQHPGQGVALQGLLDDLDATEEELTRVNNTLNDDQFEGLFSEKAWGQLKTTREKLTSDKANFEQRITGIVNPGFLVSRNEAKLTIRQAKVELEMEAREEREKAIKEQRAEPEAWELELEHLLLQDAEPDITQPAKPTFREQLISFKEQAGLDQAKESLSLYFHQARRLGVFEDLEERLDHKYQEWANNLLPHREMSQMDMMTDSPGRLTQKSFGEIEDDIIEYFNTLLDTSKPQYVEQSARWESLQRRGLTPAARGVLQGIREEFVKRAQAQIEDSLSNLDQQLKGQPQIPLPDRISGEWNVHRLERGIRDRRERQILEAGNEPLYREESYYRIRLLGNTRQELEIGADQAADNIIKSATNFDLQAMQQRMEMLLKALREKLASGDLQRSERISKSEAEAIITQIEDSVTNKIDFFILDWAGQNIQTDLFGSYLEQRMRIRGVEKIRGIPSMNDGLVGIATIELLSELYRLYYRPQGFKGQLFDDDTTHKYERSLLENQIVTKLMRYALKGRNGQERNLSRENLTKVSSRDQYLSNFELKEGFFNGREFKDLTEEERQSLIVNLENLTAQQRDQLFDGLTPDLRLEISRWKYKQISQEVRQKGREATFQDLGKLREVRRELAIEQSRYQEAERKARGALIIAKQVMNIFGEAAELGSPSIIMDNRDYIRVDEVALFYKYAILQAAKKYGEQYRAEDNMALIRWRSRMWIDRWKKAGLDRNKTDRNFNITLRDGMQMSFRLKAGFEETGLTEEEYQAFENAVKEIRENGFTAQINGVKFEDIIKMDHLKSVNNNFLADYKSSESQINNEVVLEQVAKGQLAPVRNILRRLGLKGREGISGHTTQQRIDNLSQMIEDSRAFGAELERLAYFEATHGLPTEQITDPKLLPFSADRIDYGFQNESWLIKRLHHLKAFWYTNLRRTVPRGVDLVHAMPFALGRLAKEMDFDNILELAFNVNTTANGLESVDNPALTLYADRHKDMAFIRSAAEGGVDLEKGKRWGFLEKPLVDSNSLWKLFEAIGIDDFQAFVAQLNKGGTQLTQDTKEKIVNYFQETTLGRFNPILVGTEKQLGEDRQAISSGAGFDENEKFALRFLEWLLSEKKASAEHRAREEAGMEAFPEIQDIIKLIVAPDSYSKGSSIWDEVWRKLTPSHNIRLLLRVPEPTYRVLAA